MNMLYQSLGISKQALHQMLNRRDRNYAYEQQLLMIVHQVRRDHPTMGCRDLYFKIHPLSMGRDAFERFCREYDLLSHPCRKGYKTTDSTGVIRFDNLLVDCSIEYCNQVWQSDITYYEVKDRFYYLTFILDAFSRRIVGHATSAGLDTQSTTLQALKMAIKSRQVLDTKGLIFHSDGGGQYYAREFLKLTSKYGLLNSMCEYPWENGKAERINGIIKNNYLIHRRIGSFEDLQREVDRSVHLYNYDKPHKKLGRKTPVEFEQSLVPLLSNPS